MKLTTIRELEIPVRASEEYTERAFGLRVNLSEMFNFSAVSQILGGMMWVGVLPIFLPANVDNRHALDGLVTAGARKKPFEEVDMMRCKGSEGSAEPRLYLIESSASPSADTLDQSPDDLAGKGSFWLPFKGYVVGQGLYNDIADEYLDFQTCTCFPGEVILPEGYSVDGQWDPDYGNVAFYWRNPADPHIRRGARRAIPVPLIR